MANNDHTLTQSCSHCREVKSLDDFHKAKGGRNGRHRQCKDCRSDLGKAERLERGTKQAERMRLFGMGLQKCSICNEVLKLDSFYRYSKSTTGRKGQCIECYTRVGSEYRRDPRVRKLISERRSKFNRENPEEAYRRQRKYAFKNKYGITLGDYDAMLREQNGRCAICFSPQPSGVSLYIDHCHDTGAVRGLLCRPCNSGIGFLQDDVNRMKSAIRYLENHHESTPAPQLPMPIA